MVISPEKELVSIIMPNYNGSLNLKETILSVISQTYTNWELIIVDDNSSDNSIEIINEFMEKDSRILLFKNKKNEGAAKSRNVALLAAKGKYIAFLDSDDLWMPEKLEKQINFMKINNYHFSYTQYEKIDENSNKLGKWATGPKKVTKHKFFQYDWVGCLTVIYDSTVIGKIQINEKLKSRNDYAIWLKACKKATCYLLPEILASYRVHSGSLSHSGLKKSLKNQYLLFRISENKNPISSMFCLLRNIFFGVFKKMFYERRIKNK